MAVPSSSSPEIPPDEDIFAKKWEEGLPERAGNREVDDDLEDDSPLAEGAGGRRARGSRQSVWVYAVFGLLGLLLAAAPAFPWHGWRGILLAVAGLTMCLLPPRTRLPWMYPLLAVATILLAFLVFLPAAWFSAPAWRPLLEAAGLPASPYVTLQPVNTLESLAGFVLVPVLLLYLLGHRVSHGINHMMALGFAIGAALIALFSIGDEVLKWHVPWDPEATFGPFLNRNHMATFLVMGIMAGTGVAVQSLRARTWGSGFTALGCVAICVWAIIGHSITRAGIILLAVIFLAWFVSLGRKYWTGKVLIGSLLILTATATYFIQAETKVKARLDTTTTQLEEIIASGAELQTEAELAKGSGDRSVESLDGRLPIYRDTMAMLRDIPWTGVGAGQFEYVFPLYRERSSFINRNRAIHPESDWLMLLCEIGWPATVSLILLLGAAGGHALRSSSRGRARALRNGCIMAAAAVAVHGLIDVPGHRLELVWCACWLLALSIRSESSRPTAAAAARTTVAGRWTMRLLGTGVLAGGLYLIGAEWFGARTPGMLVGEQTVAQVKTLHDAETSAQQATAQTAPAVSANPPPPAVETGRLPASPPADDPAGGDRMEQALALVNRALENTPMDAHLNYLRGAFSLYFDDKEAESIRSFDLALMLNPSTIDLPLNVAEAWAGVDPSKVPGYWQMASERASQLSKISENTPFRSRYLFRRMLELAVKNPELASTAAGMVLTDPEGPAILREWTSRAPRTSLDALMPELLAALHPKSPELFKEISAIWLKRGTVKLVKPYLEQMYPAEKVE